jgi:hypothetical protein
VKTIKATDCPSDTTGDNNSTYASVNKIRPGFIIQRNRQDVVKTIKATDCPSDTTGDNNSTYASVNKIRPGFIIQQNRLSLLYYWANDFLFFLFFFLISYPIVCKDAPASAKPRTILIFPCTSSSYLISLSIQNRQRAFLTTSCTGLTPPPVQASPLLCTSPTSCTGLSLHLLYGPQLQIPINIFNIFTRLL